MTFKLLRIISRIIFNQSEAFKGWGYSMFRNTVILSILFFEIPLFDEFDQKIQIFWFFSKCFWRKSDNLQHILLLALFLQGFLWAFAVFWLKYDIDRTYSVGSKIDWKSNRWLNLSSIDFSGNWSEIIIILDDRCLKGL